MSLEEILIEAKKHYLKVHNSYIKECAEKGIKPKEEYSFISIYREVKTDTKYLSALNQKCNYDAFEKYLENIIHSNSLKLTFKQIAEICGCSKLTNAAYKHPAWWANHHSQTLPKRWLRQGWIKTGLDLSEKYVILERKKAIPTEKRQQEFNEKMYRIPTRVNALLGYFPNDYTEVLNVYQSQVGAARALLNRPITDTFKNLKQKGATGILCSVEWLIVEYAEFFDEQIINTALQRIHYKV